MLIINCKKNTQLLLFIASRQFWLLIEQAVMTELGQLCSQLISFLEM